MYISYDALKIFWNVGCRLVLGFDGCFLKTVCVGQILSTVGRDGENCIFPVAMTVVESENYESWKWFLELLIEDLDLGEGTNITLISDQQKGLDKAIRELMPFVEHRLCTRHLVANMKKAHASEMVQNIFWQASCATHPQAFKTAMRALERASKETCKKMNDLDPGSWSKAFFKTHFNVDRTENNMSECFNSWILKARYMPIIDMLSEIHDMLMTRLHEKQDVMKDRNCVIISKMKKILDEAVKESASYRVLWDGRSNYVVKGHGSSSSVSLENKTCSCRINGEEFWEDVMRDTILPPIIKKQLRGRPKKLRRREGFEESVSNGKCVRMSYKGRIMHRGYCKSVEHMINKCPTKPKGYAPPKTGNKRGRTKKKYVDDEVMVEEELQSKEAATGETELMDDLLNQMENEDDIQEQEILNFDDDIEVFKVVQPKMVSKAAMEFLGTNKLPGIAFLRKVNLHWSFYLFSSDWNVLIFSNRYHNIKLEAWPLRLRNSGGEDIMHTLDKKRKRDNPWERVPATRVLYPCKFSRFACNNSLDGETKATIVEASRSVVALISYSGSVQLSQGCGTIIERHDATIIVLTSANLLRRHTSKDFGRNKLAKNITVHSHLCGGYFYKDGERSCQRSQPPFRLIPQSRSCNPTPGDKVIVMGRYFSKPFEVIAAPGEYCLTRKTFDCKELFTTSCKITRCGDGGPLINSHGELIGVAFYNPHVIPCLPINIAYKWWEHYKEHGKCCRPFLGLEAKNLIAADLGLIARVIHNFPDAYKGLVVKKIKPDSSADLAGLLVNDVIIKCDEKPVESFLEFFEMIWEKVGVPVELIFVRVDEVTPRQVTIVFNEATSDQLYRWPVPNF